MATLILGAVGAGLGAVIAGPAGALRGAQLGWSIGTIIGGFIDRPKYSSASYGRLSDLRVTSSAYGTSLPYVWGRVRVPGNVIWSTELVEHEQDINTGGGGGSGLGGGGGTSRSYTYTVSFMIELAKGGRITSSSLKRIHANDMVVWDSGSSSNIVSVRFYPGTLTQSADPLITTQYGSDAPAFRGSCCIMFQDFPLTAYFGNQIPNISVELDTGAITLDQVVLDIAQQCGLTASDMDVSQATTTPVTGIVMANRSTGKDTLQPLLSAYQFDLVDVDGMLRMVKRGGIPAAEIGHEDQGAYILGSGKPTPTSRITKTRMMEWELPKRVDVGYYSLTNNFQSASQGAVKQSSSSSNYQTLNVPMSMTDNDAYGLAQRELYQAWVERNSYQTAVLPKFRYLAPADVVLTDIDGTGNVVRCRLTQVELGMPGESRLTLVRDEYDITSQPVNGTAAGSTSSAPVNVPTQFFAWSGHAILDSDLGIPMVYVAATGPSGWGGCRIFYSTDSGTTWVAAGGSGVRSTFGTSLVLSAPGSLNANGFDVTNTAQVTVNPPSQLTPTSETLVKTGVGNYGLITQPNQAVSNTGDYEILGFANASLISTGVYQISDILRAQRGTVGTGHTNGDVFVKLDTSLVRIKLPTSLVGTTILVKCLSGYQIITDVTAQTVLVATPDPTVVQGQITTLNNEIANLKLTPYYRVMGYIAHINAAIIVDPTYFTGVNTPSGTTVQKWTLNASGPGGSFMYETVNLEWALYLKTGVKNTTSNPVIVNIWIPDTNKSVYIAYNGTTVVSSSSLGASGTVTISVPANSSHLLEICFHNGHVTGDSVEGVFSFVTDTFDLPGIQFYDPGP